MWRSWISAPSLGLGGRRFESAHPDFLLICQLILYPLLFDYIISLKLIKTILLLSPVFIIAGLIYLIRYNSFQEYRIVKTGLYGETFNLMVADTDILRSKGLSGRADLKSNEGMLFVFDEKKIYTFWMKDMLIPLDFIWIDGDKIVDVSENIPAPINGGDDGSLPLISPKLPVDKVIEVGAGTVRRLNIPEGNKIEINL